MIARGTAKIAIPKHKPLPPAQGNRCSGDVHLAEVNDLAFPPCALGLRGGQLWSPEFDYLANCLGSDRVGLTTTLGHQLPSDRSARPMRAAEPDAHPGILRQPGIFHG
jgi:hypothetical protein